MIILRLIRNLFEDFMRPISGKLGYILRGYYYRKRLKSCGERLLIEPNVFINNPQNIQLGSNVWIDKNCIISAGYLGDVPNIKHLKNNHYSGQDGDICMGSNVHIGINTVIQGHGGIQIGDFFTCSTGCSIYSLSNDYSRSHAGTFSNQLDSIFYIKSPVVIEDNVWLGLGVKVIGNTIHKDVFILPNSVVTQDIEANAVASGFPAIKQKARFL
jgi:acetyltransferase-like isoleucine patch superfamily enzyme